MVFLIQLLESRCKIFEWASLSACSLVFIQSAGHIKDLICPPDPRGTFLIVVSLLIGSIKVVGRALLRKSHMA